MNELMSRRSIFYKVATNEDDYTQLLCNLMQRFDSFRAAMLFLLFGDKALAEKAERAQILTQIGLLEAGRPDILLWSPDLRAIIEVKLTHHRGLTREQMPFIEGGILTGYCSHLDRQLCDSKLLIFLVPPKWKHLTLLEMRLLDFARCNATVRTNIVTWDKVFDSLKSFSSEPLLLEFSRLLWQHFGLVEFAQEEIEMLYKSEASFQSLIKIAYLVDEIAEKAEGYGARPPKHNKSGDEYGFYIDLRRASGDKFTFWFGIWSALWEEQGKPLSFGVRNNEPLGLEAFSQAYKDATLEFGDGDLYTLGWIPEEDLKDSDPVNKAWERLKPVLDQLCPQWR